MTVLLIRSELFLFPHRICLPAFAPALNGAAHFKFGLHIFQQSFPSLLFRVSAQLPAQTSPRRQFPTAFGGSLDESHVLCNSISALKFYHRIAFRMCSIFHSALQLHPYQDSLFVAAPEAGGSVSAGAAPAQPGAAPAGGSVSSGSAPAGGQPAAAGQPAQAGQPGAAPAGGQPAAGATNTEDDDDEDDEKGIDRTALAPSYEGWLDKKGDKGFLGSRFFLKRFFRFYQNERMICYFKGDKAPFIQLGCFNLNGILLVEKSNEKPFAFNITMKTSARVWRLNAKDEATRQAWMDRISPFVQGYQPPPKEATRPARKRRGLPPLYPVQRVQGMVEEEQSMSTRFDAKVEGAPAEEHKPEDGEVFLQLWGNDKAYVQEFRQVELDAEKRTWISDLPKKLKDHQQTVTFKSISDPKASLLEQTFLFDEVKAPEELLKKLVGKTIEVEARREDKFDDSRKFKGIVMYKEDTARFALYNKETNSVHFINTNEPISFHLLENHKSEHISDLEDAPLFEPALRVTVDSETPSHLAEISYSIPEAFEWKATYNGVLNHGESEMDVTAWFDVKNKSGKTFEGASIVLIDDGNMKKKDEAEEKKEDASAVEDKAKSAFGGFGALAAGLLKKDDGPKTPPKARIYQYPIKQRPVLRDNETKQLRLVSAFKVPVTSYDLIRFELPRITPKPIVGQSDGGSAKSKVESVIEFRNLAEHGLGLDLPAGEFNVSRRNADNFGVVKVGHSSVGPHYVNDSIIVAVEPLEHVTATRVQTGFNLDRDKLFMVETVEITIVNGRWHGVDIVVEEEMFRWQSYEITDAQPAHQKHPIHPRKILWKAHINSHEDLTIKYTVFYQKFTMD